MAQRLESASRTQQQSLEVIATAPAASLDVMPSELLAMMLAYVSLADLWRHTQYVNTRWRYVSRYLVLGHPMWIEEYLYTDFTHVLEGTLAADIYPEEQMANIANRWEGVSVHKDSLARFPALTNDRWHYVNRGDRNLLCRGVHPYYDGHNPFRIEGYLLPKDSLGPLRYHKRTTDFYISLNQEKSALVHILKFDDLTGKFILEIESCLRVFGHAWQVLNDEVSFLSLKLEMDMWLSRRPDDVPPDGTKRCSSFTRGLEEVRDLLPPKLWTLSGYDFLRYDDNIRQLYHWDEISLEHLRRDSTICIEWCIEGQPSTWRSINPLVYCDGLDRLTFRHTAGFGYTILHMIRHFVLTERGKASLMIKQSEYSQMLDNWLWSQFDDWHSIHFVHEIPYELDPDTDIEQFMEEWEPVAEEECDEGTRHEIEEGYNYHKRKDLPSDPTLPARPRPQVKPIYDNERWDLESIDMSSLDDPDRWAGFEVFHMPLNRAVHMPLNRADSEGPRLQPRGVTSMLSRARTILFSRYEG